MKHDLNSSNTILCFLYGSLIAVVDAFAQPKPFYLLQLFRVSGFCLSYKMSTSALKSVPC